MYLLDTRVLSELRKAPRDPNLVGWLEHIRPTDLFLSVVTIGEVEKGVAKQQRRNPAFAERLSDWLDGVLRYYAPRILAIDLSTARRWGRLADAHGHAGADLLIAATAIEYGLALVTRNVRQFAGTGVPLVDPFRGWPSTGLPVLTCHSTWLAPAGGRGPPPCVNISAVIAQLFTEDADHENYRARMPARRRRAAQFRFPQDQHR